MVDFLFWNWEFLTPKIFWLNLFKTFINYVHLYQRMKIGFASLMYVVTNAKDSAHSNFISIKTPRKYWANKIDFIWKLQKAVKPKKQLVFLPMENINGPEVQIHSAWSKRIYPKRKNTSHQCHVLVRPLLNHVQKYSDRMIIGYAMVNVVKWLVMDPILEIQDSFSFFRILISPFLNHVLSLVYFLIYRDLIGWKFKT